MNIIGIGDIIVVGLVLTAMAAIILRSVRKRKSGRRCSGCCSGCMGCDGRKGCL